VVQESFILTIASTCFSKRGNPEIVHVAHPVHPWLPHTPLHTRDPRWCLDLASWPGGWWWFAHSKAAATQHVGNRPPRREETPLVVAAVGTMEECQWQFLWSTHVWRSPQQPRKVDRSFSRVNMDSSRRIVGEAYHGHGPGRAPALWRPFGLPGMEPTVPPLPLR
jgi:hypothetical protein